MMKKLRALGISMVDITLLEMSALHADVSC